MNLAVNYEFLRKVKTVVGMESRLANQALLIRNRQVTSVSENSLATFAIHVENAEADVDDSRRVSKYNLKR